MEPKTLITPDELRRWRRGLEGTVGFVPTMGALHEGHLSLVKLARTRADHVIVSIFVNPLQFGPNEDFAKYPRTLAEDMAKLTAAGVDAVFLPTAQSMYPEGHQTIVHNTRMANGLCGASRPGHFDGVLTVVMKLFNLVRPDVAVFGKKDYQQLRLIERMVKDLDLPIEIVPGETTREADGLAMSSRNRYLSDTERKLAARINLSLRAAQEAYQGGEGDPKRLTEAFQKVLSEVRGIDLEYFEIRTAADLEVIEGLITEPAVMLVAARIGGTRLIDNLELG